MKKIFTFFSCLLVFFARSQSICITVNEGSSASYSAPPGNVFTKLEFASYGTPNGTCGNFDLGGCSSVGSWSICSTAIVGQNSFSIDANNSVFGDPCPGIPKRLYIQAVYSQSLPVKLVSFIAQRMDGNKAILSWKTDSEQNSSHFIIERSVDGSQFAETGRVDAVGSAHDYSFINSLSIATTHFYRLKMIDIDGNFKYSNIVKVEQGVPSLTLNVYPSPVDSYLTIYSSKKTEAVITMITGRKIRNIALIKGSQTVNIQDWVSGVYFVRTGETTIRFIKL
jgi:Galactose binding lectin domain/Secretion system C-terminal sorting domain